ncbi:unnamed protein product, partial [Didymodactylos carnosus]
RIFGYQWSQEITKVKSEHERDELWKQIFRNKPLKDVPKEYRWNWIGF